MLSLSINKDAFSHGQITSKLWLCEEVEKRYKGQPPKIWILGGWYGMTAFLLFSRAKLDIKLVRSFDKDPGCENIADTIHNNWEIDNWRFKAFTCDCNKLDYSDDNPEIVINTATEHFSSLDWWHNIPYGTFVALQSNNMDEHQDHCFTFQSLEDFKQCFPMEIFYQGEKSFKYPDLEYTRYMLIGKKIV